MFPGWKPDNEAISSCRNNSQFGKFDIVIFMLGKIFFLVLCVIELLNKDKMAYSVTSWIYITIYNRTVYYNIKSIIINSIKKDYKRTGIIW